VVDGVAEGEERVRGERNGGRGGHEGGLLVLLQRRGLGEELTQPVRALVRGDVAASQQHHHNTIIIMMIII
jgi:hypothetical protein